MQYTKASSSTDLYKLCNLIGVNKLIICRLNDVEKFLKDKNIENIIINLDNKGNGTHWVSCNKIKKIYFDSYAQPPPNVLKDYKEASTSKQLQSISSADCGWLCSLWLYYINYKSNKEYYDLFKDVY